MDYQLSWVMAVKRKRGVNMILELVGSEDEWSQYGGPSGAPCMTLKHGSRRGWLAKITITDVALPVCY